MKDNIIQFKPNQKPKSMTELERSAHDIIGKLEYLVEGQDHINVTVGIMLVDGNGSSTDITLSNQDQHIDVVHYEPGTNPTLNEALNKNKVPEQDNI